MATPPSPTELDKPASAKPAADEPVIHTIPEQFYGAALKKKVVAEPPKPLPPPPPPPPRGGEPIPPPLQGGAGGGPSKPPGPKPKSKKWVLIPIILVVLLAAGAGAFFFLRSQEAPATNRPANVNVPAPVCGDDRCQSPETAESCAEDCGPKPPVCGDNKCDSPIENPISCAADCGPPPPRCGDNKCEDPETLESCPADCTPPEPKGGADTESDGLTDLEETTVYGTDPNHSDTDRDSFVDLNEVLNLFDPATPAPSQLRDNPGIAVYASAAQKYEIFYPKAWTTRESGEQGKEAFFTAPTGEFIEVLVEDNPEQKPLMDWYLEKSPGVSGSDVEQFTTKQGYQAILGPDKLTIFVGQGTRVFVISYNLGTNTEIQFKITFQMMAHSLRALE